MTSTDWFHRLDARDRALLLRWSIADTSSDAVRLFWLTVTHVGGVVCSLLLAVALLFIPGLPEHLGAQATATLVISHLAVQAVKRTVGRPRPSRRTARAALIEEPDRFSFPSGHAAAAMSVALAYAVAFPPLAIPLLITATIVGLSRVALGVHYPGDVIVGQLLALFTGALVMAV